MGVTNLALAQTDIPASSEAALSIVNMATPDELGLCENMPACHGRCLRIQQSTKEGAMALCTVSVQCRTKGVTFTVENVAVPQEQLRPSASAQTFIEELEKNA